LKLGAYIKTIRHIFRYAAKGDTNHDMVEGRDGEGKLCIIGCTCDKTFWLRPDIRNLVIKDRKRRAAILAAWRNK